MPGSVPREQVVGPRRRTNHSQAPGRPDGGRGVVDGSGGRADGSAHPGVRHATWVEHDTDVRGAGWRVCPRRRGLASLPPAARAGESAPGGAGWRVCPRRRGLASLPPAARAGESAPGQTCCAHTPRARSLLCRAPTTSLLAVHPDDVWPRDRRAPGRREPAAAREPWSFVVSAPLTQARGRSLRGRRTARSSPRAATHRARATSWAARSGPALRATATAAACP
jgi:hypothetical protein